MSESKPLQSRSRVEIPGHARQEERLGRSKLKERFLIDSDTELFIYLIQDIRFGSRKDRRLNQAFFISSYNFNFSLFPFQYVFVKGGNPGVDYDLKRPVKPSETPPEKKFEWKTTTWSACSTTCGQGINCLIYCG